MLQAINDKAKGLIGGIIILIISVPFALWGIQEYLGGAEQPFAAKVNGQDITVSDFEQAVSRHRQRLQSVFGDQLPDNAAFEKTIKQQVLDQLITRALLEQLIAASGYSISDQLLAQKIHAMDAFQEDGHFVSSTYRNVLRSQGMTPTQFEQLYRRDLLVQQLQDGISKTAIVDAGTLKLIDRLQNQTRDVSYLLFKQSSYMDQVEVTDEDIQKYYEENKNRFMHPEQVSVSYIEITGSDVQTDADVDEDLLHRQYDAYVADLADKEQRKASHILIKVDADADEATLAIKRKLAESVLERLKNGESFETLAKTISEDPLSAEKGGDLGWVGKGLMVPEFEKALYELKKGEMSGLVKTGFGFHIIKLEDVKNEKPVPYEEKRPQLVQHAQQDSIDRQFYERSEEVANLAYENDQTLQPIVDAFDGVSIKKSALFTRAAGTGIANNEAVRKAAFSDVTLKEGRNSDIIEVGKNHLVVLRLDQHKPSSPKSLDEVKSQLQVILKANKAREKAQAAALQALASAQQGQSLKDLADSKHSEFKSLGEIKRDYADVDRRLVEAAFQVPRPDDGKPAFDSVELVSDIAVVEVDKVNTPDIDEAPQGMAAVEQQLQTRIANQEMTAFVDFLKSQSEIITAKDLF